MREKLFHLAAILNFAVSWCEAWNPLLGSEDPIASRVPSRVDISEDSWLHTSHQLTDEFKTNMNIVVKSNVRALNGLGVSPRVPTRSASVLETQDSFVSLVMLLNNRNNVCDASLPRPQAFFNGKSPRDERSRPATTQPGRNIHVGFVVG